MIIDEETYLSHYGVLGMKWGIRRENKPKRRTWSELTRDEKVAISVGGVYTAFAIASLIGVILDNSGGLPHRDVQNKFMDVKDSIRRRMNVPKYMRDVPKRLDYPNAINVNEVVKKMGALPRYTGG